MEPSSWILQIIWILKNRINVATPNPLQWTNSYKVFRETESYSKSVYQLMWNEAQIYLS